MRFAISLLTVICIASVIGTVLKQHEPSANYVNQFGPFWAELFGAIQLNAVYSASPIATPTRSGSSGGPCLASSSRRDCGPASRRPVC